MERCLAYYHCCFIAGDGIKATETIEAVDDAGAILEARELILRSSFVAVELWREKDFIGHISVASDLKVIIGGKDEAKSWSNK
jgi:hypothetical protein